MIRPRGGTTRRRDDQGDQAISSIGEIGRELRNAREDRGLDLLSVHDRLSRPITQIEALENGDLASLPDQALAISTLRRYATFLGLDGDALALRMIDAWSLALSSATEGGSGAMATATTAAARVATTASAGPDHLRAFTRTGEVPGVGPRPYAAGSGSGYGPGHEASGPPTGTFPVVPRREIKHSKRAVAKARRRLRAPASLKVATWSAVVLAVVAAVGFGVHQWRPRWLVQAHILRVAEPGGSATASTNPSPATGSHQSSTVAPAGGADPTGASAAYTVDARHFAVDVATSGRCWVQITSSSSSKPLVSGVQPAGKQLSVPAQGTMTVEVGAAAVLVGVRVKDKSVFVTSPKTVPFTYTFSPAAGS